MNKIHAALFLLTITAALIGCANTPSTSFPTRLSPTQATAAVRDEIFRNKPTMNPSANFPLKEITTNEIWTRLHAQLFVITADLYQNQTYIIHNHQVSPLGNSFGGDGIISFCVADLAHDNHPQLLFTDSSGSGIHRSTLGLWSETSPEIHANQVLRDDDLSLEKIDDQHISLTYGNFNPSTPHFTHQGDFGSIHFTPTLPTPHLDILLNSTLPAEIQNRIWKQPS